MNNDRMCAICAVSLLVIVIAGFGISVTFFGYTFGINPTQPTTTTTTTTTTPPTTTTDPYTPEVPDKYVLIFGCEPISSYEPVTFKVWDSVEKNWYYEWHDVAANTEFMGDYEYEVYRQSTGDWQVTIECWTGDPLWEGGTAPTITIIVGLNIGQNYGFMLYDSAQNELMRGYFRWAVAP